MKLLICDCSKISVFQLPKAVDSFYLLNFKYDLNNNIYSEVLNIKSGNNNSWSINSDQRLNIIFNNEPTNSLILKDNLFFQLKYADMPEPVPVYVVSDLCSYKAYSITNQEKISIGSANGCAIKYSDSVYESIILSRYGFDYLIERNDTNRLGTYVNSSVYDIARIHVGDIIFMRGIKIIYMRDFILINDFGRDVSISNLNPLNFDETNSYLKNISVNDMEKNVRLFTEEQLFTHSPRMKTQIEMEEITIEEPPEKEANQRTPVIFNMISSSTILIISMITLLNSLKNFAKGQNDFFGLLADVASCAAMAITSVFLPFITDKWDRYRAKRIEKSRIKKYKLYLDEKINYINNTVKKQEGILQLSYASLDQIQNNIIGGSSEIWSREIFDNDFLSVMIGVGNIPASISISFPTKQFYMDEDKLRDSAIEVANKKYMLNNVPIIFSLYEKIVMPVVLYSQNAYDYMMFIMLQIIYYQSGEDLKIVTITSKANEHKWEFMKYLPHSWDSKHERRFFATNEDELQQVSMFLEQEFMLRVANDNKDNKSEEKNINFDKYYLIVTDNYKLAREMSLIDKILSSDKNFGFSILIFESSLKELPSRFTTLVNIRDEGSCIVDRNTVNMEQNFFDTSNIMKVEIEKYAKIISNIPVSFKSGDSAVPSSLNFLDMFYAGRVDQLNVKDRWFTNNPTISLKSIIGFKENDKTVELDLHEKYHGPHGLIAGSTGSGKSEFIITYILSMAVNYHPYEVQFILIDYKGGGLAGAFENRETGVKLPHLVGTITNLDKSEMGRTLVSINSELQRRQRVFNETREKLGESTIDIYKYQRLYREGKISEPMAHLFIISDEFAELKAQQPDFMNELVSAARIGRSLGVHLILATQKPSGVVDDQIWSNTRFRVCLKVQTTEDSNEMLKRTDAAYIKEAGRFYLQVGNDEIFELGQSGWAGAKYIPSDSVQKKVDDDILFLSNSGDTLRSINEEIKRDTSVDYGDQLTNIVKYLYDLAIVEKVKFSQLWLPNIPEVIYYDNIVKKYNVKATPYFIDPVIGEYDNPACQEQGYVSLPLSECGNTLLVGAPGSGKNTLISTIIYSTIINHSSNEVNIYIIDLGAEKLKIFQMAPQVGDVLTAGDSEKIKFLFYMLKDEKDKRFSYYSENGGDYSKDVAKGSCPFPTIIVILNDFDVFKEMFEDFYSDEFAPFSRNCSKVGIVLLVTSTMTGSLGYMIESNFPKKIMLNMLDYAEYNEYFTSPPIPKKNPGRGIIELDQVYEFQSALIFEESVYEKKLNYIVSQLEKYLLEKAKPIPVIPEEITISLLKPRIKSLNNLPLGVNIKTAQFGYYNFDNLVNIISSEETNIVKKFFPRFIEILSNVKNLRIIVVDALKSEIDVPDGVKYCPGGFKKIISTINDNVAKCVESKKDVQFAIVVLGYMQLQQYLDKEKNGVDDVDDEDDEETEITEEVEETEVEKDEDIVTIDELILNAKNINNFRFILYDSSNQMRKIGNGDIDSLFKRGNGIWIGKDFDSQDIFECVDGYSTITITNNNVTVINKGKTSFLKY